MATAELTSDVVFDIDISFGPQLDVAVGIEGPPGLSGVSVSSTPGNLLSVKPDGLYVPEPQLSTEHW